MDQHATLARFGSNLKAARESAGLSVARAAKAIKVSRSTWHSWEAGSNEPGAVIADQAAELVGTTIEELIRA